MKKRLILSAALVMTAVGCKMAEPQVMPTPTPASSSAAVSTPTSGGVCSTLSPAPSLPAADTIWSTNPTPSVPSSQFIVVSTCEAVGTYVAMGVNTQSGSFTFMFKGGKASRAETFAKLYAAGVPVTVYTGPMTVKTGQQVINFDPCTTTGGAPIPAGIGDDPRDPPVPPGIAEVSWCTANTMATVKQ